MKRVFKIGLMLLFTIAFMFVVAPSKAMPLDRDVGMMFFMPENQINVDVVTPTIQATTFNCDRWLEYKTIKSTDLTMTCNPDLMINSILCGYFVENMTTQITSGNQTNEVDNFSIGDVAVNLGLRSASLTTTLNSKIKLAAYAINNYQPGVNTRLDIGERVVCTNFQNI